MVLMTSFLMPGAYERYWFTRQGSWRWPRRHAYDPPRRSDLRICCFQKRITLKDLIAAGKIRPVVDRVYAIQEET
jgi:hypothetical protein